MNTKPKGVRVLECTICGAPYEIVGDTPIGLSQVRGVKTTGYGICPIHPRDRS